MTPEEYRRIALSFPGTVENSHQNHPDFRVAGRIFATLYKGKGVVMLNPQQQSVYLKSNPKIFAPATGVWGVRGATTVHLDNAGKTIVKQALHTAWFNKSSKKLTLRS